MNDGEGLVPAEEPTVDGPDGTLFELISDSLQSRRSIGAAFTRWAGGESVLRVAFVPEMFVSADLDGRRGYLHNDIVRVQCWIESGVDEFSAVLAEEFSWSDAAAYEIVDHEPGMADMIEPVMAEGMTIDQVRHME